MIISLTSCLHAEELEAGEQDRMSARHFLKNHWPSITIAMTATVIAYDGLAVAGTHSEKTRKLPSGGTLQLDRASIF